MSNNDNKKVAALEKGAVLQSSLKNSLNDLTQSMRVIAKNTMFNASMSADLETIKQTLIKKKSDNSTSKKVDNSLNTLTKNTMVLPTMSNDIKVVKQGIMTLVNIQKKTAVSPSVKNQSFFNKSAEKEKAYESQFKRDNRNTSPTPQKQGKGSESGGFLDMLKSFFGFIFSGAVIAAAIGAIIGVIGKLLENEETRKSIKEFVVKALEFVLNGLKNIFGFLKEVFAEPRFLEAMIGAVLALFEAIKSGIQFLGNLLSDPRVIQTIIETATIFFSKLKDVVLAWINTEVETPLGQIKLGTILAGIGAAFVVFELALAAATMALNGAAAKIAASVGLPPPGMPGGKGAPGKKGPGAPKGGRLGFLKWGALALGGGLLGTKLFGDDDDEEEKGSKTSKTPGGKESVPLDGRTGVPLDGRTGVPSEATKGKESTDSVSGTEGAVVGAAAAVGVGAAQTLAKPALDAKVDKATGNKSPLEFDEKSNRFKRDGKFTKAGDEKLGKSLERMREWFIKNSKRKGFLSKIVRKVALRFGMAVALRMSPFIAGLVAAPFTAGLSAIISVASLIFNAMLIYEIYDWMFGEEDGAKQIEEELDAEENLEANIQREMPSLVTPTPEYTPTEADHAALEKAMQASGPVVPKTPAPTNASQDVFTRTGTTPSSLGGGRGTIIPPMAGEAPGPSPAPPATSGSPAPKSSSSSTTPGPSGSTPSTPSSAGGGRGTINPPMAGAAPSPSPAPAPAPAGPGASPSPASATKTSSSLSTISEVRRAIGQSESGGSYDITFNDVWDKKLGRYRNASGWTTPEEDTGKRISQMSINEVLAWQATRDAKSKGAAGLGKYGFMPDTIRGLADKYKIDKTKLFDGPMQEHFQDLILQENVDVLKRRGIEATPGNIYMAQYVGAGGATWVHEALKRGEGDISVVEAVARGWMRNKQKQGKNPTEEDKQKYIQGVLKHNKELGKIRADQFESVLGNRLASKSGNGTLAGGKGATGAPVTPGGTGSTPTPTPPSTQTATPSSPASSTPSTASMGGTVTPSTPVPSMPAPQTGPALSSASTNVAAAREQIQMAPPVIINSPSNTSTDQKSRSSTMVSSPIPNVVDEDLVKLLGYAAVA